MHMKFFLRTTKRQGSAPLYVQINLRSPKFRQVVNTHVDVDVTKWLSSYEDPEAYARADRFPVLHLGQRIERGKMVKKLTSDIEAAITQVTQTPGFGKEDIQEAVDAIVYREAREALEKEKQRKEEEKRMKKQREAQDVLRFLDSVCEKMADGTLQRKKSYGSDKNLPYTQGTIKAWHVFRKLVHRYYAFTRFTWEDVNEEGFPLMFKQWMKREGYMQKTISRHCGYWKTLCFRAEDAGLPVTHKAGMAFQQFKVEEQDKAREIALTREELDGLWQMPLTGEKAKVRDLFLFGCFTGQRFSDYGSSEFVAEDFDCGLSDESFIDEERVICLTQRKTRKEVFIPYDMDERLSELIERFQRNGTPKCTNVTFNRLIKDICHDLSESVPSLQAVVTTKLTMKERAVEKDEKKNITFERDNRGRALKPRWACVSSHTARRTAVTLMIQSGLFSTGDMMSITGHSTEAVFKEYDKTGKLAAAKAIARKAKGHGAFTTKKGGEE